VLDSVLNKSSFCNTMKYQFFPTVHFSNWIMVHNNILRGTNCCSAFKKKKRLTLEIVFHRTNLQKNKLPRMNTSRIHSFDDHTDICTRYNLSKILNTPQVDVIRCYMFWQIMSPRMFLEKNVISKYSQKWLSKMF